MDQHDERFDKGDPFSQEELRLISDAWGRTLPQPYCDFVSTYGGAFVGGLVDGALDFPILAFFHATGENSVLHNIALYDDLAEEQALPFADCELGNLYVLDKDGRVFYINFCGVDTVAKKVADCFQDFVDRITVVDE